MKDSVLEEPSDPRILGIEDYMQTPGVSSGRLSVGMTSKTLRLPKQGEILLSVHGSPLGVYKENNMDAIHGKLFSFILIIFFVSTDNFCYDVLLHTPAKCYLVCVLR
ncbi:hypothetical protein HanPI659440_Chr14g0573421 [Helianthus annuus]|nr:hypothetical protein HanPI659440_Chr14g0573421 [Helianthus annuus]